LDWAAGRQGKNGMPNRPHAMATLEKGYKCGRIWLDPKRQLIRVDGLLKASGLALG